MTVMTKIEPTAQMNQMARLTQMTQTAQTAQMPKRKLRVAAYARVSTDSDEQLESLTVQKEHYEAFIKSRPDWTFAGLYYDEGVSGTKVTHREGLLRMLDDCKKGKIDYIIVKSISRFSRNTLDSIEIVRKLASAGIRMYFEKENIDTGRMNGEFLLTVLSSLAENESKSLSANVSWGIQKRFQAGTYKIGYPPYGYKNNGGVMLIDPKEVDTVKRIFALTLAGKSCRDIAAALNEDGIPTRRGAKWTESRIKEMLTNKTYTGELVLQKTYTDSQYKRHVNGGEKPKYNVTDHHEPIVSSEDFENVQILLETISAAKGIEKGTGKYHNQSLFHKKIICGNCGKTWKRVKVSGRFAYSCQTHLTEKDLCTIKCIQEDAIKEAFVTMMNKLIFARESILVKYSKALDKTAGDCADSRLVKIAEQLADISKKEYRLKDYYSKSLLDRSVYETEMEILLNAKQGLNDQRNLIKSESADKTQQKASLKELLKYTGLTEKVTEFDVETFNRFVDYIIVYSRNEIGFVMKCGPIFKEEI